MIGSRAPNEAPIGPDLFRVLTDTLGLETKIAKGFCFGTAIMGRHAFFIDELPKFNDRLRAIRQVATDAKLAVMKENKLRTMTPEQRNKFMPSIKKKIKFALDALREDRINLVRQAKSEIWDHLEEKLSEILVKKELIDLVAVSKKEAWAEIKDRFHEIDASISSVTQLNLAQQAAFNDMMRKIINRNLEKASHIVSEETILFQHQINELLQKNIEEHKEKLPDATKHLLDAEPFFTALKIHHLGVKEHPHLFKAGTPITQNSKFTSPRVMPEKLKSIGGETKLKTDFTGLYQLEDLKKYFQSLEDKLLKNNCKERIALTLHSFDHAITVGYDPQKKEWAIINSSHLPVEYDIKEGIAEKIMATLLSKNGIVTFQTEVFVIGNDEKYISKMEQVIHSWKEEISFTKEKVREKAKLLDSDGASWLLVAARTGDLESVKALVAASADLFQDVNDVTPLYAAVEQGHVDVVKFLIETIIEQDVIKNDEDYLNLLQKGPNLDTPLKAAERMLRYYAKALEEPSHSKLAGDYKERYEKIKELLDKGEDKLIEAKKTEKKASKQL